MGLDIPIEWLTLLMFGSLLVLLMAGLPLAFVTGGLACVFLFLVGDSAKILNIVPSRIFPLMTDYQLSAIPCSSSWRRYWKGRASFRTCSTSSISCWAVCAAAASATILASTILAAMVGVIGAAVVTMGIIALPSMLKRQYDPKIAMGAIMAGARWAS